MSLKIAIAYLVERKNMCEQQLSVLRQSPQRESVQQDLESFEHAILVLSKEENNLGVA